MRLMGYGVETFEEFNQSKMLPAPRLERHPKKDIHQTEPSIETEMTISEYKESMV
jgi:hypothetical protein